ncbi:DUF1292 domain-containing protein [Slackia heliotrinireducens]|jgi:hypothetical protein|uniref:DUF1292 domain-containing protein n=1 Tax=Slackia heliotrinireducens (strain ATCC 29202 / DSM 20476 / NCTC 11029 / RHS 1) TaxID=471855 RepID=C7N4E4_SLAHD|nr:DUF1292 domain-containing protein [Slackia heliotrinireducens]ACV21779.1 hypothetical protein Shel_07210 [Slackia heliotrinireducens DSM 20476]VEG99455.1 Uncharacterised protein [Slackia heliotrinireducens]
MSNEVRQGSNPNFAPPVEEGIVFEFEDESGELVTLEFLGLLLHNDRRYGFFFPVDDENPAKSSGEVLVMEVTELDEEGQPAGFEYVVDEAILNEVYASFQEATKDIYRFE